MQRLVLVSSIFLAVLADSAEAQLTQSETRALQISALREFRATRATNVIQCIGVAGGTPAELQRDVDPDAAFLTEIGSAEQVRPISACAILPRDPDRAVTLGDRQPARVVRLWGLELAATHEARLWIWGHAEGWRCTFVKQGTVWGKPECKMIYQT